MNLHTVRNGHPQIEASYMLEFDLPLSERRKLNLGVEPGSRMLLVVSTVQYCSTMIAVLARIGICTIRLQMHAGTSADRYR